jgi:uncharacterized protein
MPAGTPFPIFAIDGSRSLPHNVEVTASRHLEGSQRPRRIGRVLRRLAVAVVLLLVVAYLAVGWYVSGEIINGLVVEESPIEYDTDVLAVSDDEIRLRPPTDEAAVEADRDAVMGLRWVGGYAQVGPTTVDGDGTETRPFQLLDGEPPPIDDDVADYDSFAFPGDPSGLDLDFEDVTYPGPDGDLGAWYVPGEGNTWVIGVHGLGASPSEFLRLLSVEGFDHPFLGIRYRNDPGISPDGDSLMRLGQEEWTDVSAAVDFARSQGAEDVVVYGPSMGGAIALGYAVRATPGTVRGLILEAPAADLAEIVNLRSGEALPVGGVIGDSILTVGRWITSLRTGIDFDDIDYIERAGELTMPVLLFHGSDDDRVPVEVGRHLAEARPDLVEFHLLDGAAHVRAWNEDPERYATVVVAFLERVGRSG